MDLSESQFQELVAQLVVRANKALLEKNYLLPMGLYQRSSGELGVVTAVEDFSENILDHVNFLQEDLSAKVRKEQVLATCVAYPDYEKGVVVALLENVQNYCAKVTIPVLTDDKPQLDMDGIEIEDSNIYIFPVVH